MNNWSKVTLKANSVVVEQMTTRDGSLYCSESMVGDVIKNLSALTDGRSLYTNNKTIISYQNGTLNDDGKLNKVKLSGLVNAGENSGDGCFEKSSIISFVGDMNQLTFSTGMFKNSKITSFIGITPKLKVADSMFENCQQLQEIVGDFSSVISAQNMFRGCNFGKLNLEKQRFNSVVLWDLIYRIQEALNNGSIAEQLTITIGCNSIMTVEEWGNWYSQILSLGGGATITDELVLEDSNITGFFEAYLYNNTNQDIYCNITFKFN